MVDAAVQQLLDLDILYAEDGRYLPGDSGAPTAGGPLAIRAARHGVLARSPGGERAVKERCSSRF